MNVPIRIKSVENDKLSRRCVNDIDAENESNLAQITIDLMSIEMPNDR
jgi:hypothetical protein